MHVGSACNMHVVRVLGNMHVVRVLVTCMLIVYVVVWSVHYLGNMRQIGRVLIYF